MDEVATWGAGLAGVHAGFRRPEPRRTALAYLHGRLHRRERKNGWQLAERAGGATPDGLQRR
ncbi:MAG TPA: IS701 family transposase, partial [Chloroflexota bacterium]|nr:IS701 family transposase [Chloroflexota bacterium]